MSSVLLNFLSLHSTLTSSSDTGNNTPGSNSSPWHFKGRDFFVEGERLVHLDETFHCNKSRHSRISNKNNKSNVQFDKWLIVSVIVCILIIFSLMHQRLTKLGYRTPCTNPVIYKHTSQWLEQLRVFECKLAFWVQNILEGHVDNVKGLFQPTGFRSSIRPLLRISMMYDMSSIKLALVQQSCDNRWWFTTVARE